MRSGCRLLFTLLSLVSVPLQAAPERPTRLAASAHAPLAEAPTSQARDWGLTEQEWSRVEALQAGPRGYWSPGLDPLTLLGVEARDEAERQRYAELQVRLEAQRAERELAYQRAYDAAWARLYPELLPVQGLAAPPLASPVAPRLALFVASDCPPCRRRVQQLQSSGAAFDLFLVDSQDDDQRLRAWARDLGIDPARVREGRITLNHGQSSWRPLAGSGPLPATFQPVDGQWQRVE